jgi:hypothetical protein
MAILDNTADGLLRECQALQAEGKDFDQIYTSLLRTNELAGSGKVMTARGETTVRSIPLRGGEFVLLYNETAGAWSLQNISL